MSATCPPRRTRSSRRARACAASARAHRPGRWRAGDGCVVQLLVKVDEYGVGFDLAGVNRDGAAGEHADRLAGGQVVARRVGGADQRVILLEGALVQGLLLVGAGVVDRPDVVIIEADEADRLAELVDQQGVTHLEVVEVRDDYERHGYVLSVAGRRGAGWLPRTSIQPLRIRVRSTGCGWLAGPRPTEPSARAKRDPCSGHVTVRPATVPRLSRPPAWLQMLSMA